MQTMELRRESEDVILGTAAFILVGMEWNGKRGKTNFQSDLDMV